MLRYINRCCSNSDSKLLHLRITNNYLLMVIW